MREKKSNPVAGEKKANLYEYIFKRQLKTKIDGF